MHEGGLLPHALSKANVGNLTSDMPGRSTQTALSPCLIVLLVSPALLLLVLPDFVRPLLAACGGAYNHAAQGAAVPPYDCIITGPPLQTPIDAVAADHVADPAKCRFTAKVQLQIAANYACCWDTYCCPWPNRDGKKNPDHCDSCDPEVPAMALGWVERTTECSAAFEEILIGLIVKSTKNPGNCQAGEAQPCGKTVTWNDNLILYAGAYCWDD
jgi:hypothetical protein